MFNKQFECFKIQRRQLVHQQVDSFHSHDSILQFCDDANTESIRLNRKSTHNEYILAAEMKAL